MDKNCFTCKFIKKDYKYCSVMFKGIYTYGCEKCRRTVAINNDEQLSKVYCEKFKPKETQ